MCVAHEDHVDARNLFRDRDGFVFVRHLARIYFTRAQIFSESHVHRDHDDVSFLLLAQNRNPLARFGKGS